MRYKAIHNSRYDFEGQNYGEECFPHLHKYPATMIPQLGIEILKELDITDGSMLDPYCGSGSSFASGISLGLRDFTGFDLNPLAVLISKVRFTKLSVHQLQEAESKVKKLAYSILAHHGEEQNTNILLSDFDYWFSEEVAHKLTLLKNLIEDLDDDQVKKFLMLSLSLTVRDCSYVRNNEFKLYRIKEDDLLIFNPDVVGVFFSHLKKSIHTYQNYYEPFLDDVVLSVSRGSFVNGHKQYDVVLTSPPYGDSRTTVAYGQFSIFTNQWLLGFQNARAVDKKLMGGENISLKTPLVQLNSLVDDYVAHIATMDNKRAREINSFYYDLAASVGKVSHSVKTHGRIIYVVGNRTVKGINLPTDQFVAEQFEKNGFSHLMTYKRSISNKRMPHLNSPSNKSGVKMATMKDEFIIVCEKTI